MIIIISISIGRIATLPWQKCDLFKADLLRLAGLLPAPAVLLHQMAFLLPP